MKTVYLLGAGFSAPAGAPLTNQLIPAIVRLAENPRTSSVRARVLQPLVENLRHWYGDLSLWDYEELLTIAHSELLFEIVTGQTGQDLEKLREDLMWAGIYMITEGIGENPSRLLYDRFIRLLRQEDSIVSLNYDVVLESALIRSYGRFDAGIPKFDVLDSLESFLSFAGILVLKIHGSSNLLRCDRCKKWLIKDWKIAEDVLATFRPRESRLLKCTECPGKLHPVLVPPVIEKTGTLPEVQMLWRKAARELKKADKVISIGCSLRPTDFDLLTLLKASLGDRHHVPLEIVNPTERAARRYKEMLPNHSISPTSGGLEFWLSSR